MIKDRVLMDKETEILEKLLANYPALTPLRGDLLSAYLLLQHCYEQKGIVLICGNGGSAADAEHIAGELMKGFLLNRPLSPDEQKRFTSKGGDMNILAEHLQNALPAVSLVSQTGLISAFSNDVSPDLVYAQQVYAYAKHHRAILIALSTSGSSENIVKAVQTAQCLGVDSIGITGQSGGRLKHLCSVCLCVPSDETFRVQEYTLPIYHALCAMLEAHFFSLSPPSYF